MHTFGKGTTVVVAMSGGVDSSVAAALLVERGCNVIGVTMKTYDFEESERAAANETSCCGLGAVHDARMVAASLAIPHYTVDFRKEFGEAVIGTFVQEYLSGRTPNPCVICNREIKWGALLRKAEALGAQCIATGHYARVRYDEDRKRHVISRARYIPKDQSYALWAVTQEALAKTVFPIGELAKPEVREVASRLGLRTANKQESFDICFVEDNKYDRFLKDRVPDLGARVAGGEIVHNGLVIGRHSGYPFYTVGQRRGIGAHGVRMYVTGIRPETNVVDVGPDRDLWKRSLIATDVSWSGVAESSGPLRVRAKVRYSDDMTDATVTPIDARKVRIDFDSPKRAITPGQSAVFYLDDDLAGGGIIREVVA